MKKKKLNEKEPLYVAATLKWCNTRRKEKGKKPLKRMPKGIRTDPHSCPCGAATGAVVGSESWHWPAFPTQPLPREVIRFVDNFDEGNLPQYDAELKS